MKKIHLSFFLFLSFSLSAQQKQPYKIIAYATGNAASITQFPIGKLIHIIYSFLKIQNDTLTFHDSTQESNLRQVVALKQTYPQLKIMVSVGGWSGCSFCSDLFANQVHWENFTKTVALFKQYGIDGLDLDWGLPGTAG